MGARSTRSEPPAKDAALFAALLAKHPHLTLWALVDDGRLRETAGKTELEFVGWSPTQTKTTLAAGVRAIGFAASLCEAPSTGAAHLLLVWRRAIVTQRSFPQVVAGVGASTRRRAANGARVERGDRGWHPRVWDHPQPEPDARLQLAVG